jgi:alanyl aminopeptidase
MAWWDDLWLNESFADWMGDKITIQEFPEFDLEKSELVQLQNTIDADARPSAQAVHRQVEVTEDLLQNVGTQYNKGKCVLGMFEQWIGPQNFRRGVLDYLHAHAWGNAQASDLWSALSKVSGQDVSGAMATFIDQPGLPLVRVEPQADGTLQLSQSRFHSVGVEVPPESWKIPVTLKYSDGTTARTETVLLDGASRTWRPKTSTPISWVLPNAEARGYYRWSVPPKMLTALTERPAASMRPAERIGFLGNLEALLMAGVVHGDDYLRTLARFADDPEPQVIAALAEHLDGVQSFFVPEDMEDAFAVYLHRTLGPSLQRWGLEPKPGEPEGVTLVRPKLLAFLGDEGRDPQVRKRASELARSYMTDPASVDASIAPTVLNLAAVHGDRKLFDEYRQHFESAKVPSERSRYLHGLGAFRDPALADAALQYSLDGPLRPNELASIAFGQVATPRGRDRALQWTKDNWPAISSRMPKEFVAVFAYLGGGCDAQRFETARTFFSDPGRETLGMRTNLAKVSDSVGDCTRLRDREGASASAYLMQLMGSR